MKDSSYTHKCMNVLGNELRMNIIAALQKKEQTVQELVDKLDREQSAISHALQHLRECSFVDYKQKGKEREYYLKSKVFSQKGKTMIELLAEHAETYCKGKH